MLNNSIIRTLFVLSLYIFLTACNTTKYINIPKNKMDVVIEKSSMNIEKVSINSEGEVSYKECETIDVFFSISQSNIIDYKSKFNIYDMSYNCYNSENKNYSIFHNLYRVISRLKHSHFIIENKWHDFIILDENLKNENVVLFQDCAFKYFNSDLLKSDTPYTTGASICISDLRIKPTDDKIRIYYYFKPNKKINKDKNYKASLFVSNWITLM